MNREGKREKGKKEMKKRVERGGKGGMEEWEMNEGRREEAEIGKE